MTRVLCCLLLFGLGAEALGGGAVGVILSGGISLWLNHRWKEQERRDRLRVHRERIIDDERVRLQVAAEQQRVTPTRLGDS
jgi:hypothetical protein